MLALSKLYPTLSYAENEGLFDELNEVYQRLPETTCDRCATCCTVPPPGYLIEFLNLFRYVRDNLKTSQREIMENTLRYFFLELVDINVKCPFLDGSNNCKVYPVRPLSCRMFGLLSEKDSNLGARRQLGAVAEKYRQKYDIQLPSEVVDFQLQYCDKVRLPNGRKKKVSIDLIQDMASKLETLEAKIMPQQVIEEQYTFAPMATHLALSVLPEGARLRRPKVMKEYLEKGSSEMLDKYIDKFSGFKF
jgi:Fe-S-cluster containining protein